MNVNLGEQTYPFMKPLLKVISMNFVHVTNALVLQFFLVFTGTYATDYVKAETLC